MKTVSWSKESLESIIIDKTFDFSIEILTFVTDIIKSEWSFIRFEHPFTNQFWIQVKSILVFLSPFEIGDSCIIRNVSI